MIEHWMGGVILTSRGPIDMSWYAALIQKSRSMETVRHLNRTSLGQMASLTTVVARSGG